MLSKRIFEKDDVRIAVIGIGYVGLPLAIKLAENDFSVLGVDIKQSTIAKLQAGKTTVEGISDERICKVLHDGKLTLLKVEEDPSQNADETIESLIGTDVFIVCVPTPLHSDRGWDPETGLIANAAALIRSVCEAEDERGILPKERLVVLESTTYPGTTRKIFSSLREDFGKKGMECLLAYSPERTSPGLKSDNEDSDNISVQNTFEITRIVGGIDPISKETADTFYKTVFLKTYPVNSLETAEMIKLVENTFRFVSIGFANEMARIARTFGLNIWEIIHAAKTKGFGLDLCYPGLIGGHCLPIDPHYLGWAYRNRRSVATFVEVAEKSHQDARRDALELIQRLLSHHAKGLPNASILFFGIAYKKNISDIRESGVIDLMKKLFSYGAEISFWDPLRAQHGIKKKVKLEFSDTDREQMPEIINSQLERIADNQYRASPNELTGTWEELRDTILSSRFDCIVLATDHDDFHKTYFELLTSDAALPIIDLNNAIDAWLEATKGEMEPEQSQNLRKILIDRSRYMLFGCN